MIKTITFEDHGQDFLEWDIEILSIVEGRVVGCRPFQADIWCGCHVMIDDETKPGDHIVMTRNFVDAHEIKYPIKAIEEKAA